MTEKIRMNGIKRLTRERDAALLDMARMEQLWRRAVADLAASQAEAGALRFALTEIETDTRWRQDMHPSDPKAMRYTLDRIQSQARAALSQHAATGEGEGP